MTQPITSPASVSTDGPASAPANGGVLTFEAVKDSARARIYVRRADEALAQIGYTEHGERHVGLVSRIAFNVMKRLGSSERDCELAAIAGWLHDIGNAVNRENHAQTGATMAMQLLHEMGM